MSLRIKRLINIWKLQQMALFAENGRRDFDHQCWFSLIQSLAFEDIHYISEHFTSVNNTLLCT